MASLIPGFEYDIFISYRQKDNKGDRWVSEFVEAFKTELESTFKEEISVYFDVNPHDGLLEIYDVDASLKDKLKCLIFIPIISRTYCDPKSFAWEHEFRAFTEQTSKDNYGLKVKLPNGNVASRVLPVRIHDLDNEDIKLCESVLGGVLRGIEFIYKESGFNRPLKPDDDEKINLNKTRYRNQISKVALAVREIIQGINSDPVHVLKVNNFPEEPLGNFKKEDETGKKEELLKPVRIKLLWGILMIAILLVVAIIAYPKIFRQDTLEKLRSSGERISVAVMPFQNMTNDTTWNIWQDGIQNNLVSSLANSDELKIRQSESVAGIFKSNGLTNYASLTPQLAGKVAQKLDASIFVFGSINKADYIVRLNAQLIDSKSEEIFKSFQIDGTSENILKIIDSMSSQVRNFLIISALRKRISPTNQHDIPTYSPDAFRYFILGNKFFYGGDNLSARNCYLQALSVDSNFSSAATQIAVSYNNQGMYEEAKQWTLRLNKKIGLLPIHERLWVNWLNALFFETPYEEINYLKQLQELDDLQPPVCWLLGNRYYELDQFDNAIPEFENALEIFKRWGLTPPWVLCYSYLGSSYHKTGQFEKEKKLYKRAEMDFPDDPALLQRQAILALSEGALKSADQYINKYVTKLKESSAAEADVATKLASIYEEVPNLDKAEEYCRKALSLQPENTNMILHLAYLLIENERNINEGLKLIDRALKSKPDDYLLIDTKGWGFHKLGKNKEALELLEKSDSLKPMYDHILFLHIQKVKKVIADLK